METKITGFPQSSNEYDAWIKQGRTWKDGSWWEAESTTPIIPTETSGNEGTTEMNFGDAGLPGGTLPPDGISKTPDIPSQTSSPDLPDSNAQTIIENYTNDYISTLDSTRKTLEAKYKSDKNTYFFK